MASPTMSAIRQSVEYAQAITVGLPVIDLDIIVEAKKQKESSSGSQPCPGLTLKRPLTIEGKCL